PVNPVPLATLVTVPVPADDQLVLVPSVESTLPLLLVCVGNSALSAALAVVCPVPPLPTGRVPVTALVRLILLMVLLLPLIVLLVRVWVASWPTKVVVASGKVTVRLAVCAAAMVVPVLVVPPASKAICLVLSVTSRMYDVSQIAGELCHAPLL